jgi:hypothetical protein
VENMSIELHCPQCGKQIRAPDDAGGRFGKCPYCERKVYIPTPPEAIEEIPLAPIDTEEERREEELRREAMELAAKVAHDKSTLPAGEGSAHAPTGSVRRPEVPGEVVDIGEEVERFVLAMRDSKLDQAEKAVNALKRTGQRGKDYVQGVMLDEMPPDYENVPAPLAKGFLKALLGRLS